jgi:hypothetical protein
MKKNTSADSLARNHRNCRFGGRNGPCQPPRNSTIATELIANTAAYSPRKNSAHFMLEYSVWNPATSSDSASGRSNGARLVSASAVIMKITNERKPNGVNTYQPGRNGTGPVPCACTISTSDRVPAMSSTGRVEIPIDSSYEIICADERRPPSSAYLLFDDQPPSVIA